MGRTSKRSDERKAFLAVEAHIRHIHTPYEELLREGLEREQAREVVWDTVQELRNAWRGQEIMEDAVPPNHRHETDTESEVISSDVSCITISST